MKFIEFWLVTIQPLGNMKTHLLTGNAGSFCVMIVSRSKSFTPIVFSTEGCYNLNDLST